MSFERAFLSAFVHVVQVEALTGADQWGQATYAPAVDVRARVQAQTDLVRGHDGREVASHTLVLLAPTTVAGTAYTVGPSDRITLPAGFAPRQPPLLSITPQYDVSVLHHWELRL